MRFVFVSTAITSSINSTFKLPRLNYLLFIHEIFYWDRNTYLGINNKPPNIKSSGLWFLQGFKLLYFLLLF